MRFRGILGQIKVAKAANSEQCVLRTAITQILDFGLAPPEIAIDRISLNHAVQTITLGEGEMGIFKMVRIWPLNRDSLSTGGRLAPPAK